MAGAEAFGAEAEPVEPDPEPEPDPDPVGADAVDPDPDPDPDDPTAGWWRTTIVVDGGGGSVARVAGSRVEVTSTTAGAAAFLAFALAAAIPPTSSSAAEALAAPTTRRLRAAVWPRAGCDPSPVPAERGFRGPGSFVVVMGSTVRRGAQSSGQGRVKRWQRTRPSTRPRPRASPHDRSDGPSVEPPPLPVRDLDTGRQTLGCEGLRAYTPAVPEWSGGRGG